MKKRTKRILAMLLASAMILQQGSTVGVLATETEPASETVAETQPETTAETQAPETTAETKASETQVTEAALGTTQTDTPAATQTEQSETVAATQIEQSETVAATQIEQSETTAVTETTETTVETTDSTKQSETTVQETTEAPAQNAKKTEALTEAVTEATGETDEDDNAVPDSSSSYGLMMAEPGSLTTIIDAGEPTTIADSGSDDNTGYTFSQELEKFLKELTITDETTTDASDFTVRENRDYGIELKFKEDDHTGGLQFGSSPLVFTLPEGFKFADGQTGPIDIKVKNSDGTYTPIDGNTFRIEDGKLYVTLNDTALSSYADVEFSVKANLHTTKDIKNGSTDFGGGVTKEVVVKTQSEVSVDKSITFYDEDGTAHYAIIVKSDGTNTNVNVSDVIPGNILVLQQPVTAKSNKKSSVTFADGGIIYTEGGKGFSCTIPEMEDGEEITFEYTAKVDWSKVTGSLSQDAKTNTVTVKSTEQPDSKTDTETYGNNEHQIAYNWADKEGSLETGKIEWTLTVNETQKASAAGQTVTDTIKEDSRPYISYQDGETVTITVYDESGGIVRTDQFTLSEYNMLKDEATGRYYQWTYQIPTTDAGHNYKYVFSYSTDVTTKGLINKKEVENEVSVGDKGTGSGGVEIEGENASVEKNVVSYDKTKEEIEWEVKFHVPVSELKTVELTDTLPLSPWFDGKQVSDSIVGSVTVTSEPVETLYYTYEPATDGRSFKITFYKDEACNTPGMNALSNPGSATERVITIKFKTQNNGEWIEHSKEETNSEWFNHINNVDGLVNNASVHADAEQEVRPKKGISLEKRGKGDISAFTYVVKLEGVESETLELTDTYDKLLTYTEDIYNSIPLIVGTDVKNALDNAGKWLADQGGKLGKLTIKDDTTSHKLTINVSEVPKKDDGSFYPYYYIVYMMKVADENKAALYEAALKNGGKYEFVNSVAWGEQKDSDTREFQYGGLTKQLSQKADNTNGYVAEFKLDVNSQKFDLVEGNSVTIVDTMTNLVFKPNTLSVEDAETGASLYYTLSYTVNDDGQTVITIVIPDGDGKHITIKYQAQVSGSGEVTYSNNAVIVGYKHGSSVSEKANVSSSGEGSASERMLTLYKYKAGDLTEGLSDAWFELYVWHEGNWLLRSTHDSEGNKVDYFKTGEDGTVKITGDAEIDKWSLSEGNWKLVEKKAPSGYEKNQGMKYEFTISPTLTPGVKDQYMFGGTIAIPNEEGQAKTGSLSVNKIVSNPEGMTDANGGKYIVKVTTDVDLSEAIVKKGTENVEVTKEDEGYSFTFEITGGASIDITGLPEGNYMVEETSTGLFSTAYEVNGETIEEEEVPTVNVTESSAPEVTITNTYKTVATSVDVTVNGTKNLNDKPSAKTFSFKLEPVTGNPTDDPVTANGLTAENGANGRFAFDTLTFTKAGTYKYTVRETSSGEEGYDYDSSVYYVTVVVSGPDASGALTQTTSVTKGTIDSEGTTASGIAFNNTYTESGSVILSVKKTYSGDTESIPEDGFTFKLEKVGDAPMPATGGDTVTVTAADLAGGTATKNFGAITYDTDGDYYYTVRETVTGLDDDHIKNSILYDTVVYGVKVHVAGDGKGGKTVTVTYDTEGGKTYKESFGVGEAFTFAFTNTEIGELTEIEALEIPVHKTVKPAGSAAGYKFKLEAVDGAPIPEGTVTEVTTDVAGNAKFKLEYEIDDYLTYLGEDDDPTPFVYKVSEVRENPKTGITYDETVYTVTVTFAESGSGYDPDKKAEVTTITANMIVTKAGKAYTADALEFVNNTTVKIGKADENGQLLSGAKLKVSIKDAETGALVAEWTTDDTLKDLTGNEKLVTGKTYILEETEAPRGYRIADPVTFSINGDGQVIVDGEVMEDGLITMTDTKIKLEVNKKATGTGEELDGAVLELLDKDGKVLDSWTSKKGQTHDFGSKLKAGESYTLRETVAPDGYTCVTDMKFTVAEDGTVTGLDSIKTTDTSGNTVYVVEDTLNKVSIEKVDESGAALSGAKLVIRDAESAVVDSWTTDGKAHEITGLAKGKYTLSEVEAPEGYEVSKDVPFEITGTETVGSVLSLRMTDTKIPDSNVYSLTVTKHLRLDGVPSELAAKDVTYYVALFSDAEKTQRVSNVKKIEFHNETSSTVTFDKLAEGTYYVGETDENGTLLVSKIVNNEIIFYPEYSGDGKVELEGRDTDKVAGFTNVYMKLTNDFYLSGQITVTKKILVNGEEGTSDETYYARLFTDPELTDPLDEILALDLAGNSSASVTVTNLPIGETLDSTMSYYVAETDENGNVLDPDAVTEFEISVDKSEIVLSADNSAQEVVITNSFTEEETETETETETEVPKKAAPKTGDDTDFMRYLLLMALSAGTCAVAFEEKRRRNRARK